MLPPFDDMTRRRFDAVLSRVLLEPREVALHDRRDVGVRDRRARALVLAVLRQHLVRRRRRDAALARRLGDEALVLRIQEREEEAHRQRFDARRLDPVEQRLDFARGSSAWSTSPRWSSRSFASNRSSSGTSGGSRCGDRSYKRGRVCRPMASTSRKPRVVISAVRAPLRSMMAFVATVEPWTRSRVAGGRTSEVGPRVSSASPSRMARAGSSGVEGACRRDGAVIGDEEEVGEGTAGVHAEDGHGRSLLHYPAATPQSNTPS